MSSIASTVHTWDAHTQLAKAIDEAIKASGMSVSKLARTVNVDSSSISRWRRDAQRCPPSRIKDLADALGLGPQKWRELTELAMQAELERKQDQRSFRSATIRHELDDVKAEVQLLSEEVRRLRELLNAHLSG
jgi:transposase-like protein